MGNCLVTKLKEVVNNPNLIALHEVLFPNVQSGNFRAFAYSGDGVITATVIGDGYFEVNGQRETTHVFNYDDDVVTFVSNGASIKCDRKGSIHRINIPNVDYSSLKYLNELVYLSISDVRGAKGDVGNLHNTKVNTQTVSGYDIYGDLNQLPANGEKWWFRTTNVAASDLGAFVASTKDRSTISILLTESPNVSGTIEGIVSACVDAGRTNKSIILDIYGTGVTFGGSDDVSKQQAIYSGDPVLKWTDKTHITFQLGNDADVADTTKNVHIFAKGATAEQISTWESQGNTVHVIS